MEIQLINHCLIEELRQKANNNERLRQHFDLRTSSDDGSQRMLNVLQPGTKIPIHRHLQSAETVVCIEGCFDEVFYEELPNVVSGGLIHDGEETLDETCFKEVARFRICPKDRVYGIQIPPFSWHSIEVIEPSVIFEAKDGRYHG
jgi:hypothetical protein